MQQGPVARILFRLRPCVNLSYCLLLIHIPWFPTIAEEEAGVLASATPEVPARTWTLGAFLIKSVVSTALIKTEHLRECSPSRVLALYASTPNHVFGQMLGLPGSCVLLPYVPLHRLMRHQENYCDCAPVRPGEHLSRESQKLTVMI